MTRTLIAATILSFFFLSSCDSSATDSSNSPVITSSNTLSNVPFDVKVKTHKFSKLQKGKNDCEDCGKLQDYVNGYMQAPGEYFVYLFDAELINRTQKRLVSASFFNNEEKVTAPYIQVEFEDTTFTLGYKDGVVWDEVFLFDNEIKGTTHTFETGAYNMNKNPWENGTSKSLKMLISASSLLPIHFDYIPKKCVLVIPVTVKDAVGYRYSNDIVVYDILDDWKSFQQQLKSTSQANSSN